MRARRAVLLALLLWSPPAFGHLLDEVAESLLCDLVTEDRQLLVATWYLEAARVESYFDAAEGAGLQPERSAAAFATRLATGFRVPGCTTAPATPPEVPAPRAGTRAFRVEIRCPAPLDAIRIERVDYSRERTRSTLYLALRVAGREPRRLLLPPRVEALEITLDSETARPIAAQRRQRPDPAADPSVLGTAMPRPGDPQPLERLPPAGPQSRRWWRLPPTALLVGWAEEGARHLLGGPDHLLFVAGLSLAAARIGASLAAVLGFSLGHLLTMAAAIAWGWPSFRWVEVAIGLSILWAAWTGRREPEPTPGRRRVVMLALAAAGFGLIHGAAFGAELRRVIGVSDGLLWPLAAFGVGLDAAQSVVAALAFGLGIQLRGRVRVRAVLAGLVGLGGLLFATRALLG